MTGADNEAKCVRLEGVPTALFLESQDHQHDLIREFQLIELADRFNLSTVRASQRLSRLIGDILSRYQPVRIATRQQALAAFERGDDTVNLEVPVRPGMEDALREWLALLEEADQLCGEGDLLVLAARPEVRELRQWYVREVCAQLQG